MGYYAVSCLGDALDATEEFLFPLDRGQWLRLAVVVFFLSGWSGSGSVSSGGGNVGAGVGTAGAPPTGLPSGPIEQYLPLVAAVAVVLGLVGLAYALVGSVMEFVLVDAVRRESVTVRASFREYLREGLSLFAFQVVLFLVAALALGGTGVLLVWPALAAGPVVAGVAVLGFALVGLVVGLVVALAYVFTLAFVVPVMVHEERGLVAAWRRFWGVLRANRVQFLVYLAVRVGLALVILVGIGTVAAVVGFALAVPFVLVGGLVVLTSGFQLTLGTALLIGLGAVAYLLALTAALALVMVPVKTYTRYYELLVLGDVDPALDLVAERREKLRSSPV